MFITVLAFALQSYFAQTHIHAVHSFGDIAATHAHGKAPTDNNQLNCPFCQAVTHAGVFLTPAPPLLLLPAWAMSVARSFTVHTTAGTAAHSWHSRAPPQR